MNVTVMTIRFIGHKKCHAEEILFICIIHYVINEYMRERRAPIFFFKENLYFF